MNEWRPIETAPRDGSQIVLWRVGGETFDVPPGPHAVIGNWLEPNAHDNGCWNIPFHDEWAEDGSFAGWMPLPPPPTQEVSE